MAQTMTRKEMYKEIEVLHKEKYHPLELENSFNCPTVTAEDFFN